jgi:hypothetical protein
MTKRVLSFTVCVIALGVVALAQDEAEYQKWMKTAGATAGSLRKSLEAKNGDAASADARKLQDVFQQVHDYWNKKGVNDAMTAAMDATAQFKAVGDLASAGKFEDAGAALKKGMSTCGTCHTAHREKAADGSWKIK